MVTPSRTQKLARLPRLSVGVANASTQTGASSLGTESKKRAGHLSDLNLPSVDSLSGAVVGATADVLGESEREKDA